MYQQIVLIGNLGNDPEMRYTPSGVPVASFNLAVNKTWTNSEGQRQDKTTWFRVTTWRKNAEIASQYLNKGRQVLVVGELEDARAYTDREGNLRASLEVTAQTIKFLGRGGDSAGGDHNNSHNSQNAQPSESRENNNQVGEEDIPF